MVVANGGLVKEVNIHRAEVRSRVEQVRKEKTDKKWPLLSFSKLNLGVHPAQPTSHNPHHLDGKVQGVVHMN